METTRHNKATRELNLTLSAIATVRTLPFSVVVELQEDRRHAAEIFEGFDAYTVVRRSVRNAIQSRLAGGV